MKPLRIRALQRIETSIRLPREVWREAKRRSVTLAMAPGEERGDLPEEAAQKLIDLGYAEKV